MNAFDVDILRFLNQFAHHSRVLDGVRARLTGPAMRWLDARPAVFTPASSCSAWGWPPSSTHCAISPAPCWRSSLGLACPDVHERLTHLNTPPLADFRA